MIIEYWAAGIVLMIWALVFFLGWRRQVARTAELNRFGALFGVERWRGEPNDHYRNRIYDRIDFTEGKQNAWQ